MNIRKSIAILVLVLASLFFANGTAVEAAANGCNVEVTGPFAIVDLASNQSVWIGADGTRDWIYVHYRQDSAEPMVVRYFHPLSRQVHVGVVYNTGLQRMNTWLCAYPGLVYTPTLPSTGGGGGF